MNENKNKINLVQKHHGSIMRGMREPSDVVGICGVSEALPKYIEWKY